MNEDKVIFIFKVKQKMCPDGTVLEKEQLTVQGKDLKECRKHFDELWESDKK